MKTLVAQLWDEPDLIGDYHGTGHDVDKFWYPCMDSIKQWAQLNNFEYIRYCRNDLIHLLPDLSNYKNIMDEGKWNEQCFLQLCMLNNPNYDRVVCIDADITLWGNPQLADGSFCALIDDRFYPNYHHAPFLIFPQGGLYHSTCGPEVYEWFCNEIRQPSEILQYIITSINLARAAGRRRNGFSDQDILISYAYYHKMTNEPSHICWQQHQEPKIDSFYHFIGPKKMRQYQRFKAFLVYQKIDKFWASNVHELKSKGIV